MHNEDNKNTCMACSCPCEMHKEHNHSTDDKHGDETHKEVKSCSMCGTKCKQDSTPVCGCK